ncbi:MAG: hypothetical protein KME47_10570 [Nodosilinea sp. WJT8-NPBG4]|jgi:hypothetical protein|nr:hypothetical protein [Nodosilinea sp. WJT8-NPBG4]
MVYPATYEEAIDFFIALLKKKKIGVRFYHPRMGNSLCESAEVYAVDQPVSFSLEELAPIKDFLCMRDANGFNSGNPEIFTNVSSIAFQSWVEFEYLPDAFASGK